MKNTTSLRKILCAAYAIIAAVSASAMDRFELEDGSVVLGKLLSAENGKFKVDTAFAGKIDIDQAKVKIFTTDEPVNISLASGTLMFGKIVPGEGGAGVKVISEEGQLSAPVGKVAAVWRKGEEQPQVRQLKEEVAKRSRNWEYEVSMALTGRSGASDRLAAALGFKATLATLTDKLIFDLKAERARENGIDTANRQFGSADYSAFFSEKNTWYARTSLEKDAIKALDLRSTTAFGFGHKLIKKPDHDLEARVGVSYLYENYTTGTTFDSPGMDVGLLHIWQFKNGKLTNTITYTPAFKDIKNYRIHHESSYEVPLTPKLWKLKIGLSNDYTGQPPAGVDHLDTMYFTSLLLDWK
jgi:putative salt-induced outer membrane protein YdiY